MFDTHAHLNFNAYKDDLAEVIKRCREKNITIINVGSQYSTSVRAVKLAEENEGMYAAVGLHPFHLFEQSVEEEVDENESIEIASRVEDFDYAKYFELAKANKKVVAIGECGPDFHYENSNSAEQQKKQLDVFNQQINLANELGLPMIIHCRDAYDELIAELKNNPLKNLGVAHCFGGNVEQAKKLLDMGFYLGFTGVITFPKRVEELHEVVRIMPLDRILTETDCPYLTPVPYRGQRNEPSYVEFVVSKIADLRGISINEVIEKTDANARNLFKII